MDNKHRKNRADIDGMHTSLGSMPSTDIGASPQRQPLLESLVEVSYLLRHDHELDTEEQEFMTQLRQQFEQFKADLRREATQAGLKQGKVEGKAEALLAILAARGVAVNNVVREKILACRDQALLDRWLVQAVSATSAEDVFSAAD